MFFSNRLDNSKHEHNDLAEKDFLKKKLALLMSRIANSPQGTLQIIED